MLRHPSDDHADEPVSPLSIAWSIAPSVELAGAMLEPLVHATVGRAEPAPRSPLQASAFSPHHNTGDQGEEREQDYLHIEQGPLLERIRYEGP
jgi:hypothetical protein